MLVGLHQQVKDLGQPKVRRLHVRHFPSGKRRLDLASARASYERASALWPHEQQHSCIGRGNRRELPPHRPALSPFQIVEGPCVEDQPEAGADTGRPQRRHVEGRAAIARTAGWVSHWLEQQNDPENKIGRPRQIYTGSATRDYVPADKRG